MKVQKLIYVSIISSHFFFHPIRRNPNCKKVNPNIMFLLSFLIFLHPFPRNPNCKKENSKYYQLIKEFLTI